MCINTLCGGQLIFLANQHIHKLAYRDVGERKIINNT